METIYEIIRKEAIDRYIPLYNIDKMKQLKEGIEADPNKYRKNYEHFYSKTTNSWKLTHISLRSDINTDEKYLKRLENFEKHNGEMEGQLLMSEVEKMGASERSSILNKLYFYYRSNHYKEDGIDFNVLACISVVKKEIESILQFKREALREYNTEDFIRKYGVRKF